MLYNNLKKKSILPLRPVPNFNNKNLNQIYNLRK